MVAEHHGNGPRECISERTDEQIVDETLGAARADLAEAEKNLATLASYLTASNRSCIQVASDHKDRAKASAEEVKKWADATKMLHSWS